MRIQPTAPYLPVPYFTGPARSALLIAVLLTVTACNKAKDATPTAPSSAATPTVRAPAGKHVVGGGEVDLGAPPADVAAALKALKMGLKGRLQAAMKAGGPVAAMKACNLDAGDITAKAQGNGIRLGRTSTRLRNPSNTIPAWANKVVMEAKGKRLDKVPGRMTLDIGGGKKGYLEMIGTAGICLKCHGPSADLDPKLKTQLAELYPQDQATGYKSGQIRGWFWAEYTPK